MQTRIVILILFAIMISNVSNSQNISAPKLVDVLDKRTQAENSVFQISCAIEQGSQPLFFEWSKNGQSIRPAPDVKYVINNQKLLSTLTIENVARSDAGNYSCLVKNAVGSDSQTVLLNVKGNANYN